MSKDTQKLYVIMDELAEVMASPIMTLLNDNVALFSFNEYVENELKKKGLPLERYALYALASIDEKGEVLNSCRYRICNGLKSGELYQNMLLKLQQDEE